MRRDFLDRVADGSWPFRALDEAAPVPGGHVERTSVDGRVAVSEDLAAAVRANKALRRVTAVALLAAMAGVSAPTARKRLVEVDVDTKAPLAKVLASPSLMARISGLVHRRRGPAPLPWQGWPFLPPPTKAPGNPR
ncbi:MAG: hypothetical protein GY898_29570 [Proteobacteria bacterium]|nr:hypothetical protein [Pseudomonadota bacterium]